MSKNKISFDYMFPPMCAKELLVIHERTIKQRLHKLLKTKRNPVKELIDHLPTESSNQELIGLHILGESKFDKERDFAK